MHPSNSLGCLPFPLPVGLNPSPVPFEQVVLHIQLEVDHLQELGLQPVELCQLHVDDAGVVAVVVGVVVAVLSRNYQGHRH